MTTTVSQIMAAAIRDIFDSMGIDVTWNGASIKGHYARQAIIVNGVETYSPTLKCVSADIAGMVHGDEITIGTTTYYVVGFPSDPAGSNYTTLIALSEDPIE
jgi:hypothetical protein